MTGPSWADLPGDWKPNGAYEEVEVARYQQSMPEYDPVKQEHLWVVAPTFRVDPTRDADQTPMLDHENLLFIAGPFCFHCEQSYQPRLQYRRCKGEPRGGN